MPTRTSAVDDDGVVAIELVLVMPFLVAILVAIASFGGYFSRQVEVTGAARDAARTLALRGTPSYPPGVTVSAVSTCPAGNSTSNASVTLSYDYAFAIPFVPLGTRTITATSRMRCGG